MHLLSPTKSIFSMIILGILYIPMAHANDPSRPSSPSIPPSYEVLHAAKLITAARVNFPAYQIDNTNGYRVKAPNGTEFIVDNIVTPKCAFYGTYVSTNDDGFLGGSGKTQVNSNVYIGEVNFEKCQ